MADTINSVATVVSEEVLPDGKVSLNLTVDNEAGIDSLTEGGTYTVTLEKKSDEQEIVYGGPYMAESEAIEAELLHAHNESRDPDLWGLFKGKQISQGAIDLINTHLEGHPDAGYQGERHWENPEINGVPMVQLPTAGYVFPGEGGLNTVDVEAPVEDKGTPPTLAPTEDSAATTDIPVMTPAEPAPVPVVEETKPVEAPVVDETKTDSVIANALASVEESPYVEGQGKHSATTPEVQA